MKSEYRSLIDLLKSLFSAENYDASGIHDIMPLVNICKRHNIDNMLYYAVVNNGIEVADKILSDLRNSRNKYLYQYANQTVALERIQSEFERCGIDYMLMKGSVLRALYPSEDMRTCCDIDILYKREDFSRVKSALYFIGGEWTGTGNHDEKFFVPPDTHVEMHQYMMEPGYRFDLFQDIWDRVKKCDKTEHGRQMSNEDFYCYIIAHMARHFEHGGCGIRSVIDVFLYLKEYRESMDFGYINERLAGVSLDKFERNIQKLVNVWFYGEQPDELCERITDYIFSGNVYGTYRQKELFFRAKNAGKKSKAGLRVVFLPLKHMKFKYKILDKLPFLLPVFWVVRAADVVWHKRDKLRANIGLQSSNGVDLSDMSDFIEKTGL